MLIRLHETIAAVCPILGVSGVQGSVRIDFDPSATVQQQTNAQTALTNFDWSQAAEDAWLNLQNRADADTIVQSNGGSLGKALRAEAAVLIDELNNIRQWIVAFKAQTALATNLANFQTRVAALPDMPDRTLAQAKTAIQNKLNGGTVD